MEIPNETLRHGRSTMDVCPNQKSIEQAILAYFVSNVWDFVGIFIVDFYKFLRLFGLSFDGDLTIDVLIDHKI